MDFTLLLSLVSFLLERERRLSYRYIRKQFTLDDETLEELRYELVVGQRVAVDDNTEALIWIGAQEVSSSAEKVEESAKTGGPTHSLSRSYPEPGYSRREGGIVPISVRSTEAERRQLTVMFCDLVGSTALSTRMDPEDLRDVITSFQDKCREAISRYDGFIARYMGDGMLVYFGYPQAHEEDAERAIRAGLDVLASVASLNADVGKTHNAVLAIRVGVATGPVVVGDMIGEGAAEEAAVVGETPNLAARLQAVAQPNQLVIGSSTRKLVGDLFTFDDLGVHELKGIAEPTQAWRVTGAADIEGHLETRRRKGSSPLIGRQEELGLLNRSWETSISGYGQVVLIQGDPGFGKSRLLEALREPLDDGDYEWVSIRCSPYHSNSPLYPVVEHFKRALGWQPDDDDQARLLKLEAALEPLSTPLEEVVPLYAEIMSLPIPDDRYPALGMTPKQQRDATLDAIVGWALEVAESKPVLHVWEDLHWADPTTRELLGLYIDQSPTVPILNVLTYRPDFVPPWPMRSHMTPIALNRLERPEVESFVRHLSKGKSLPDEVLEHIVAKADGVPLYIEELTKTIIESQVLIEEEEGYRLNGTLAELQIPSTLQDSLMSRLDRAPTLREVAQMGSVLGREFAYDMLNAAIGLEETVVQSGLEQLVEDELLYQRGRGQQSRYIFKHALIQDAAYQSLLKRTRQQYHHTVAKLLEKQFPELAQTQPGLVAHHFAEAGAWEQAANYWQQATTQALGRSANEEAVSYLTRGIEAVVALPDSPVRNEQELEMQIQLAVTLIPVKNYSGTETVAAFSRARELCGLTGNRTHLITVNWGEYTGFLLAGKLDAALAKTLETLREAEQEDNVTARLMAHRGIGITSTQRGDFEVARNNCEAALALYDPVQHRPLAFRYGYDIQVAILSFLDQVLLEQGYPTQARARYEEALKAARDMDHPPTLALALWAACFFHWFYGDLEANSALVDELISVSKDHGLLMWELVGRACRGHLSMLSDPSEAALAEIEAAMKIWSASATLFKPWFLTMLAQAHGRLGRPERGLACLDDALSIIKQNKERLQLPFALQTKAELLLAGSTPDPSAAESILKESMQISREMNAHLPELRTATRLARLWVEQGKAQEALKLLTDCLDWFTEGFDAPDLQAAQALVDELKQPADADVG
jgi:class 3 adenylate cyclase/tetratricopeptide (TPR) repeat protein